MRVFDWSRTPLGSPHAWPENLRIALGICLTSRFPMHVWWGPELTLFYNDGYISFLGKSKHPAVLGRSGREAWSEVWDTIGPMIEGVLRTGVASWSEDFLMFFDRELPREEVYVTFSFSPVLGEGGRVDGLFCACSESTEKLVGNRRLETLRKLGLPSAEARTPVEPCGVMAEVLRENPHDVPFAAIYLVDEATGRARLTASVGLPEGVGRLPEEVSPDDDPARSPWPIASVLRTRQAAPTVELASLGLVLPGGPWPEPSSRAVVLPIRAAAHDSLAAVLLAGVSPRRPFDDSYRAFFELVAGHIGTAIADARAYEEERRRAEALAELDRTKTAFFSNVSHEFRAPLTLMLGPLEELLQLRELTPAAREALERVHRNGLSLLKLVNSLLDFSRIEAGRVQAAYQPTDLASLTSDLASAFRSTMERAGLRFTVDCAALPQPVYVDRDMWEKIVLNLLSNAFKFTYSGEIEVRLRAEEGRAVLTVRDTGTGIPPSELPHVFERFHRIAGGRSRTHEGTGIGLALVSELVKLHGGQVSVRSEPERGSTFTVSVPFGTAHLAADRLSATRTNESTALSASSFVEESLRWLPEQAGDSGPVRWSSSRVANAHILIVDDNADMRAYLRRILGEHWNVEAVADGEAALAAARAWVPDLVLTDVMMPGLGGFELVKALRDEERTRTVPVVLLSARAGEEARIEGLKGGADDYLVKPFSARELLARVEAHLGEPRNARHENAQRLLVAEQRARASAEHSNRMKDEFLARVSHELATPVAAMKMWLEVANSARTSSPVIEQALGGLRHCVRAQSKTIDDLLDTARALTGKLTVMLEASEPGPIVEAAVAAIRPVAEQRGISLELSSSETPLVNADATRLQQVVSNLLSNAVKFTPPGGRISVRLEPEGAGMVIVVQDTGRGFSPEFRRLLFSPFRQEQEGPTRTSGGLGLGLAIARQLVELHGGRISGESMGRGLGATFRVWLPGLAEEGGTDESGPGVSHDRRLEGVRVLLVDDDEQTRVAVALVLEEHGATVESVESAARALEALRRGSFDAMLCDIAMPEEDGYSLIRKVRALGGPAARIPAAAFTAHMRVEDTQLALASGFQLHMPKSVEPAQMIAQVWALARGFQPPTRRGDAGDYDSQK
jgi:signal transduction histidine kinase